MRFLNLRAEVLLENFHDLVTIKFTHVKDLV